MAEDFCLEIRKLKDKEVVFKEGDDLGDEIYLVLSGRVSLTRKEGKKQVVVDVVGEREGVGDVEFFGGDEKKARFTAQALGRVELCVLSRKEIRELMARLSPLFKKIVTTLSNRFSNTSAMTIDLSKKGAREKKA